ncbi:site-2 protease family protein [Streptomyces sp. NPDC058417]|uniref:site-2 protease family protein n=1 Tax=unclassified Streptomyces TaxID=2593676 RepID=UPI003650C8EC
MVESGGSGRPRPDSEEATDLRPTPASAPAEPREPAPRTDTTTPDGDAPQSGEPRTTGDTRNAREPEKEKREEPHEPRGRTDAPEPPRAPEPSHAPEPPAKPTAPEASEEPKTPEPADEPKAPHDLHPDRPHAHTPSAPAPARGDADPAATPPLGTPAADTPGAPGTRGTPGTRGRGRPPRPPEPRGGLLMGRPFGVPVYVAPSWFLVAALITWVFGGQLDRVLPELGGARYLVSLFFAVAFYASVLVHELAHTIAALRFKLPVRRIQLQFFGGVSEIEKEAETPGREFVLAFVGPLLSLVLAGLFYLAMLTVEPGTVPGVLLAGLMISNLIVAAFNLLPGLPLDGGRMLRAVVWKLTGRPMTGTVAAAWVGRALAVSVLIGLPLLTQSGALGSNAEDSVGMDTVLDALLAAILAAIIWTGAGNSLRMARLREHLPELRARNLTRRAVPVETHTPLSEALRRANDAGARALVVVDAHGEPVSLVREAAIVGVPEHRRPWVAVSGLAADLTDGMRVSAELAGEDLLDALRAAPATEYLVVEETGEIYGVLSAADVERAFVKAMARPS